MELGKRLRAARKALGLTHADIASWFGVDRVSVSNWEKGLNLPEAAKIPALCRRLRVSADHLFFGTPSKGTPLSEEAHELARAWDSMPAFARHYAKSKLFDVVAFAKGLSALAVEKIWDEVPEYGREYIKRLNELEEGVAKIRQDRMLSTDDGIRQVKSMSYVGPDRRGTFTPPRRS